jgi:hypothetical protein
MTAGPLFRIAWARSAPARPLTPAEVVDPELVLGLHGPGSAQLKKSHHDDRAGDPWYLWSGTCAAPWAVSFRHRRWRLDLRAGARVVLRTRQSGGARLHLIVGRPAGDWLISDDAIGASRDWHEHTLALAATGWRRLAIDQLAPGAAVVAPDLAVVDAIGVAGLDATAGGAADCVRLDWLDLHAVPVPRARSLDADAR